MAPPSSVPPSLPPSVEEAYRRKCVQLKNRTSEVEDANDAARLRLARIKRQVEKLRIERAFLLEQLSKRTSANVEDSEGSPSPPPTPKDKPLRIKRGHRKSALADVDAKAASHNKEPASPSEFPPKDEDGTEANPTNGVSTISKGARSAFHLYTLTARPLLEEKYKDDEGDADIDDELARGWDDLAASEKEEYRRKFAAKQEADKEEKDADDETLEKERKSGEKADAQDEDVEMTNYDSEDQDQDGETQLDKDGED